MHLKQRAYVRIYDPEADDAGRMPYPPWYREAPPCQETHASKVARSWYREMSHRFHPDRGGTHEQMLVVNAGNELLRQVLGLAA